MFDYIKGTIIEVETDYIVLDNNNIGYKICTANPYEFEKNTERIVYVYQQVREDAHLLFGFPNKETKKLFLKLITVKGVGCKTACTMLAKGDASEICNAINNDDVAYLKKIPGIGPKAAQQIILDLKGKLSKTSKEKNNPNYDEAIEVLKALGYKNTEIKKIGHTLLTTLNKENSTNDYVKLGLSLLSSN